MKHAIQFALLFTCCQILFAQQQPTLQLSFNHLALSVKDLNRSVDFYKRVLNLTEITNKTKVEGIRWFSLGEGKELHLISDAYYKRDTVITNKAIHMALTTNNFDQLVKIFDSNHIKYSDWPGVEKKVNIRAAESSRFIYKILTVTGSRSIALQKNEALERYRIHRGDNFPETYHSCK